MELYFCFIVVVFFIVQDIDYYNVTSVFLGVGVICVWVGLLRFFTYFKEYNVCDYYLALSVSSVSLNLS